MKRILGIPLGIVLLGVVWLFDHYDEEAVMTREDKKNRAWAVIFINICLLGFLLGLLGCSRTSVAHVSPQVARDGTSVSPTVVMTPLVQNNLDFFYHAVAEKAGLEASFCMIGAVDEKSKSVLVQSLTMIWIDSADASNLHHRPSTCTHANTIGVVHFHPPGPYCHLSSIDVVAAHNLSWPSTAVVCKPEAGKPPQIIAVLREDFEREYNNLTFDNNGPVRQFVATYRYVRPP